MAIKRTKWDAVFSDFIRYRDKWTCQRCKVKYVEKSRGLHCSHFYGRRSWATRIEPANAMALCYSCHIHVGSFPMEHVDLWEGKFSKKETDKVNKLHNQSLVKKKDIATDESYELLKKMLEEIKNEL